VESGVNTGLEGNPKENENTKSPKDEKKQTHKKYIPSINRTALQELEGTTTSSFVDLAQAVILIDGVPYDKDISHYAQIEIYGKRKYHIKSVFNRVQKDIPNDIELKIKKKEAYTKAKPITQAQKEARRILYKANKEKEKREKEREAQETLRKAEAKANELRESPQSPQNGNTPAQDPPIE
jgi:hypothetical protein